MTSLKRNWKRIAAAALCCAALLAFVADNAAEAQVIRRADAPRVITLADLYEQTANVLEKAEAIESRMTALDERLARIEGQLDELARDMKRVQKALDRLETGRGG